MSPFDWCNGCYCGRGPFQPCSALSLPDILETYIFFFVIILLVIALGFCCYAPFSKLHQNDNKWPVYKEVVYNGDPEKMNILGQTCAVCLEDFKVKDEMAVCPCQHGFHKKCLVKWLQVRCCCPMCNKPVVTPPEVMWAGLEIQYEI